MSSPKSRTRSSAGHSTSSSYRSSCLPRQLSLVPKALIDGCVYTEILRLNVGFANPYSRSSLENSIEYDESQFLFSGETLS